MGTRDRLWGVDLEDDSMLSNCGVFVTTSASSRFNEECSHASDI
jgi:hypothetical protein